MKLAIISDIHLTRKTGGCCAPENGAGCNYAADRRRYAAMLYQRTGQPVTALLFVSGHTHAAPTLELDTAHSNLYLNNGSHCPSPPEPEHGLQQGNATLPFGCHRQLS